MVLKKPHYFALIVASIPLLFFLLLEAGLRLFDYGDDLSLFVPASGEYAENRYLATNPNVAQRYFPGNHFIPRPKSDVFLKDKPEHAYRVFVLGGSTVAGWPYPNSVMFSRRLQQLLASAFPARTIEVISLGIAAVNSYTLRDFIGEVVEQQADAVLIYAGHNEYYGALGAASTISLHGIGNSGWLIKLYLELQRSRLFRLLGDAVYTIKTALVSPPPGAAGAQPYMTLMGQVIGEHDIAEGSETYFRGLTQFENNLRDILRRASEAGLPVLVSELVSNVRDQPPFFYDGEAADSAAAASYREARELEAQGDFEAARVSYYRAKDLDGLRFRAPEAINALIREIAGESDAGVVPMKSRFEDASTNGLVGNDLMLDHLHPNAGGYLLMAQAFFDSMRDQGLIITQTPAAAEIDINDPYTEMDSAIGELRAMFLKDQWPFRPLDTTARRTLDYRPLDEAESNALKIAKDLITHAEGHLRMASYYHEQGDLENALREYAALISSDPYKVTTHLAVVTALASGRAYSQAADFLARAEALAPGHPAISRLKRNMPAELQNAAAP